MGRKESFQMRDMRCPEVFYGSAGLSETWLNVLWDFPPRDTRTPSPSHPSLFLRRVEAGDSSARIIVPAMEGNREIFWKQKLQHWGCPLFFRTWIHETYCHVWTYMSESCLRAFQVSVWFYCRKSEFWQGFFSGFKWEILEDWAHHWQLPSHRVIPVFQWSYVVPPALRRVERMFWM